MNASPLRNPNRSHLIDVFENYFGDSICEAQSNVIAALDESTLLDLADLVDESLAADRLAYHLDDKSVMPIPYSVNYQNEWLDGEETSIRLSLLHDSVVVPVGGLREKMLLDPSLQRKEPTARIVEALPLETLHRWALRHRDLIRGGTILPLADDVYLTLAVNNHCTAATEYTDVSALLDQYSRYAPVIDNLPHDEREDIVRSSLLFLYERLFVARRIGATPAMSSSQTYSLWRDLLSHVTSQGAQLGRAHDLDHALLSLNLPSLANVSPGDIQSLHNDSEAFAIWRERLRYVLRNVHQRVVSGADINSVFQEEALPIREAARGIEKELKNSSVFRKLRQLPSTFTVGAISTLINSEILGAIGIDPAVGKNLIKVGPPAVVAFLWWLLFDRPTSEQRSVLRIYSAFTD